MKNDTPISSLTATIISMPVGAVAGLFLGWSLAAAKLMGDAEIYQPSQLPPPPDLLTYLGVGLVAGVVLAPMLFAASWQVMRIIRSYQSKRRSADIAK